MKQWKCSENYFDAIQIEINFNLLFKSCSVRLISLLIVFILPNHQLQLFYEAF